MTIDEYCETICKKTLTQPQKAVIKKLEEIKIDAYNQALDDFYNAIEKHQQENWISNLEYGITFYDLEIVKNELKK